MHYDLLTVVLRSCISMSTERQQDRVQKHVAKKVCGISRVHILCIVYMAVHIVYMSVHIVYMFVHIVYIHVYITYVFFPQEFMTICKMDKRAFLLAGQAP